MRVCNYGIIIEISFQEVIFKLNCNLLEDKKVILKHLITRSIIFITFK